LGGWFRSTRLVVLLLVLLAAVPAAASASFPGTNPNESVRVNTPNDPGFDSCEADDEQGQSCSQVFDEQYERFGFAPNSSENTAVYHNPLDPHVMRMSAQNMLAGRNTLGQVPGTSTDRAWKYSTGSASVQVAILDTGIRWGFSNLRKRVALNRDELPLPEGCTQYDCNGDGAFNVIDYSGDSRVSNSSGHSESDSFLDPSDLIGVFSDGTDGYGTVAESNGYVDDIAGWDFFDNDNDPYDASSYSSAGNHGSHRAEDAAEEGNDADGGIGHCPGCQIVPMRVWDTFVVDTNNFAQAVLYAADNDIEVVEGAVGGLFNSRFARQAFDYAYRHGTFLAIVSSDLNTADHNIPTLYDEAFHVQGIVADAHGLGQNCPQQCINFFKNLGVPLGTNIPIGTWFRNSGTTQYGGHAHIVMPGPTGSQATGQASGAIGLLKSYARQQGIELAPNELKQLITETAFDIQNADTTGLGVADPAQVGWDQHFGYGLPDLGLAMERISQDKIPPQALISSPEWFTPYNVNNTGTVDIRARLSSRESNYNWSLQWAPGIEPQETDFQPVTNGSGPGPTDGVLGSVNLATVRSALDTRVVPCPTGPPATGGATCDPTAPAKGPGDKDPNEPAFTVRVVVTDSAGNRSEDRKMLFAYRDATETYNKDLGTGGEASQRLWDINGDNVLDTVLADSSGELSVLKADGTPLQSFNNGQPLQTQLYPNIHPGAPPYGSVDPPREVLRTPAIGDIDGDLEPEIVDTAGEHVYAWNADGSTVSGFPVRIDPNLSLPQDRTRSNHVKRGFSGSPVLGDLVPEASGQPRKLEIVATALDQHVYAWDGAGNGLSGFPKKLHDQDADGNPLVGAEIINTAALGDIAGDGKPEIVTPTAELECTIAFDPTDPASLADYPLCPAAGNVTPQPGLGGFGAFLTNVLANFLGGSGRVYAVDSGGNVLSGWPTKPQGIVPDALPLVGPGEDHIMANVDNDPQLEVVGEVATGDVTATNGDGSNAVQYDSEPSGGEHVDKSKVLNLFENPIAANIDGNAGPEIIKGGITLNQLVNIGVGVGQNLPYNHVIQAWNAQTGAELPSFPQAVEDFQLLSSPSVADVSNTPGNEILVGTGLYYLRSLNVTGLEGAATDCSSLLCWPKFTGGWIFATPAIGDTDGDGNLDVTTLTREGHAFSWDTNRPACGTNDEWWTSRHDEWNTGAYGTDTRPPGTPRNPHFNLVGQNVQTLAWTTPGDDWLCGEPTKYRIIGSPSVIRHPTDGTVIGDFDPTVTNGQEQAKLVTNLNQYYKYFAVLYRDDAGNWGHMAKLNLPDGYARPQSATPIHVPLVPAFETCVSSDSTHAAPLAAPSCNPPASTSGYLTVGAPDVNGKPAAFSGSIDFTVLGESPINPNNGDQADIRINTKLTDIRKQSDLSDYTGELRIVPTLRITDRYNGPALDEPATASEVSLPFSVSCAATAGTIGGECALNTTADAVMGGAVREGQRAVLELGQVKVYDGGADGDADTTGDNTLFAVQGVFAP
jgi:subtilase family protein